MLTLHKKQTIPRAHPTYLLPAAMGYLVLSHSVRQSFGVSYYVTGNTTAEKVVLETATRDFELAYTKHVTRHFNMFSG